MDVAEQLIDSFARIVRGDGGAIRLVSADEAHIEVAYIPGTDEACDSGACVLPHLELQDIMREWLSRRAPGRTVLVRLARSE